MPLLNLFRKQRNQPPGNIPDSMVFDADLQLEASESPNTETPAKFKLFANSGQEPMRLNGFMDPLVIDLKGARFDKDSTPVIMDHDTALRIGHTTAGSQRIDQSGIYAEGVVSSSTDIAAGFVEDAKAGFPFQVSVGAKPEELSFVEPGKTATVNGKEFQGPLIIARKSLIRELSVTVLGADSKTAATIAASSNPQNQGATMPPTFHSTSNPPNIDAVSIERQRIQAINNALKPPANGWGGVADEVEQLRASAIDGSVSIAELPQRVLQLMELDGIRNERPNLAGFSFNASYGNNQTTPLTLEAAIAGHARIKGLEKHYDERTLEASQNLGVTCLMDAAKIACQMAGRTVDWRSKDQVIKAAFSTADFSILLSNVAGKSLEAAYKAFPSVARLVSRKLSASDFKTRTGVRVTGDIQFKEVAGSGEIKHAVLNDASYTYQLATFARMFGLDRQSIIGDDLDALEEIPRMLGRGAALAIEETFWTLVLGNANNFFHADNGNLLASALDSAGLASAVQAFLEQTDQQGKPIGVVPERLVVPPSLKADSDALFVARTLNVGGGSTSTDNQLPAENVHFGKYEPSPVPWIGANGGLAGGSDDHWYLFGNPEDVPAFGICYLDNRESPVVEQEQQEFNKLGVQWRGYIDFGVCQIDHRGAVRSAGA